MLLAKVLFWTSFGILAYVFVGFVAVLWIVSRVRRVVADNADITAEVTPSVSVIVCAFNEAGHIRRKIENCLALDYPPDRVEIIVVSDGSSDDTDRILQEFTHPAIRIHRMASRVGKTACQNLAVRVASHEVLFFTDATVMHPPDALRLLVGHLQDPSVGCVTGRPVFRRDEGVASKGLTKRDRYEFYLRARLAAVSSLLGAQDCIYIVPRRLYVPVRADLDSGFVGPLLLVEQGYRTVYEPKALAFVDRRAPSLRDEWIRRSRIALRGMRGLLHMRRLMDPVKHGFVAVSLISTRLLRWLTPVFLATLFVANVFLLGERFYAIALAIQIAFYLSATIGLLLAQGGYRLSGPLYAPAYFCILASAAAAGLSRLVAGETGQVWETRR